jgi:hypothetical protein
MSCEGLPCVLYKLILSYVDSFSLWRQIHPKRPFDAKDLIDNLYYTLKWIPHKQLLLYEPNLFHIIPRRCGYHRNLCVVLDVRRKRPWRFW